MSRPPSPPPSTRNNNTFSPDQPAQYLSSITQYGSFRTIAAFLGTFPYPPTPRAHAQLFYTVPADDSTFLHRLCFRGVTPALLETIAEKVAEKVQHSTHGNLFSLSDSRYRWTPLHLLAGYSVNLESIKIVCRECPESLGLTETRLGKTPFEVAQIYEPQRANHAEVLSLLDALTRAFHSGGAKEVWGITGLPLVRRRAVELRWTVLACMTYGRRENATDEAWANMHGFFHGVAGRDMYSEILSFI